MAAIDGRVRIGILGAAAIAPAALIKPARLGSRAVVAAVAARDISRAEAFAGKHGIPRVHPSYDDLVGDPEIDAVYVPLPNGLHGRWTIAALEAGKHVLCEKPFTANADEAERVAAVARAHPHLVVMEAFHWRYHPQTLQVLEILERGDLGDVALIEAAFCFPLLKRGDIRWNPALAPGALMDAGCYPVSMIRHLGKAVTGAGPSGFGREPRVVSARARLHAPGVDDAVANMAVIDELYRLADLAPCTPTD